MKTMLSVIFSLLLTSLFAGCGASTPVTEEAKATHEGAPEQAEESQIVQYLQGTMQVSSAQDGQPYGPPVEVLAIRNIDRGAGTIVEESWHDGEYHKSTFTLQKDGAFSVEDDAKSYTGTIRFASTDWQKGEADYEMTMTDGSGMLTGRAFWEGDTMKTEKTFSDPSGQAMVKINEALKLVSPEDFEAAKAME